MRLKNKAWARPFIATHPEIIRSNPLANWKEEIDGRYQRYHLEIGCGKGGFITSLALQHPNDYFIGIERALTAIAIAGKKVESQQLTNVHLWFNDVSKLEIIIPSHTFQTIYLNFSDPWPKIRHHKRRLTADSFLRLYDRILIPQGIIKMKTDNLELIRFSKANFAKSGYVILEYSEDYSQLEFGDVPTEYELAFRAKGLPIYRLVVRKAI